MNTANILKQKKTRYVISNYEKNQRSKMSETDEEAEMQLRHGNFLPIIVQVLISATKGQTASTFRAIPSISP